MMAWPPRRERFFPEERVEFRDLARSIMFAFSSRLAECCLVPSTKSIMRNKKLRFKSGMELFLILFHIVYRVTKLDSYNLL